jgi:RNA polymerase sigma factor for flagellar operon FliA
MNIALDITDPEVQRLIKTQTPMVERIAKHMARRLPASVECSDLIQDGMVGLIGAILRWTRETSGGHFDNYVAQRAHGAMLDGLRANDPGTRQRRKDMRRVEVAIQQLGHQHGRAPLEREVATALGMDLADYQRILQDVHGYMVISLEDLMGAGSNEGALTPSTNTHVDPLAVLERSALRKALLQAINDLPEQKKSMLQLYYVEELKMHEIGVHLEISEARVSQLHTHTIALLRASLYGDDPAIAVLKPRAKPR